MTHFISMNSLRVGDLILSDGGFDCLPEGAKCEILADSTGMYVICADGNHYLDSQRDSKTGECIGFRTIPASEAKRNIQSITIMADATDEVYALIFTKYTGKSVDLRLTDPAGKVTVLDGIHKSAAWSVCNWFESMWKGKEITIALCDSKD